MKVNYLVLSYLCLVHLAAASALLLPMKAGHVALACLTRGWSAVPLVFFLPVVCWMHGTYAVNSVCHDARFGSRLFEKREGSHHAPGRLP